MSPRFNFNLSSILTKKPKTPKDYIHSPGGSGASSTNIFHKQSGSDWGMEDDWHDLFGGDIMDMDPHSPDFADAVAEDTAQGIPSIPGELDENDWTDDFGDMGQTSIPQDDPDEPPEPGEPGEPGDKDGIKTTGGGAEGRQGGYGKKRIKEESRRQMNLTGSSRSSLLTGRYA